ncbi:MAG: hypothetical protein WBO58_00815, partial [Gammaproteobacteria bacterium]
LFAGFDGPRVKPGNYSARVSRGAAAQSVTFQLKMDSRLSATDDEIQFWSDTLTEISDLLNKSLLSLDNLRLAQRQIKVLMTDHSDDRALQAVAATAIEKITSWDSGIIQVLHQTYEDEDAWETMLVGQLRYLMDVIDKTGAPVTGGALLRLADLKAKWAQRRAEMQLIKSEYIDVINQWAQKQGVPHVTSTIPQ